MSDKLAEILKRAKLVDQVTKQKFDRVDNTSNNNYQQPIYEDRMVETYTEPVAKINNYNGDAYRNRVETSNLPAAIKQAMMENPIPQADMPGTFSVDDDFVKQVNGDMYSESDEVDFMSNIKTPTPKRINENVKKSVPQNTVNDQDIRRMIAEEIAKALPNIVDKYFNQRLIEENIGILKNIKVSSKKSR